jgi:hypothetical protein
MKHAKPHLWATNWRRLGGLAIGVLLVVVGCSRPPGPPLEKAKYYFYRGEFDAAMKVVDAAVAETNEPSRIADLLAIKGRCYWELANRVEQADTRAALLQSAVDTFSKSIEATDNAEARHVRALVYDMMGEDELATADKTVARSLDETYQRAYINEKPEEVLPERRKPASVAASSDAPTEDEEVTQASRWRQTPDESESSDEDPLAARQPDAPWSGKNAASAEVPNEATAQGRNRREPGPATRSGQPRSSRTASDPGAGGTLPLAENEPQSESAESAADASDETATEPGREEDTANIPPPSRRLPSSTWQRVVPPTLFGDGLPMRPSATTGITGPGFGAMPSSDAAQQTSPLASQPTTGITGPPGLHRPAPPEPGTPAVPTTGIGAAPVDAALPSGIPSDFLPRLAAPMLPFTGALPPQFQPPGVTPQIGPRPPVHGPSYSPLYPSPLTTPGATALGPQAGMPNVSTSPLVPPKVTPPPRRPAASAPRSTPGSLPAR